MSKEPKTLLLCIAVKEAKQLANVLQAVTYKHSVQCRCGTPFGRSKTTFLVMCFGQVLANDSLSRVLADLGFSQIGERATKELMLANRYLEVQNNFYIAHL